MSRWPLTNVTDGGAGTVGFKHSNKTRRIFSKLWSTPWGRKTQGLRFKGKALSKESRAKIGAANRGRIPSEETRQKLSDAGRGKKHSLETRIKMRETAIKNNNFLNFKRGK